MVLAVDIGNSNICIGGLAGKAHRDILFTTRMVTRPRCTADEYAAELRFLLGRLKVDPTACEGVIVCSVVPGLTPVLAHACKRLTGRDALIVSNALDTGLTFAVDEPDRVGRDRLADAAAAAAHYPLPCMTVDMGTATTYNVLSAEGCFLGGFIVPSCRPSPRNRRSIWSAATRSRRSTTARCLALPPCWTAWPTVWKRNWANR